MKRTRNFPIPKRLLLLFLILFTLFSVPLHTANAAVSFKNVQTVSGGKFQKSNNKWVYRKKDGQLAKDCLLQIKGKTYYFSKNGYRLSGWRTIEGSRYYFGKASEGYLYKYCWLKSSGSTYFLQKSGRMATGLRTTKAGRTYYFGDDGKRRSGWVTLDGKRYYFGTAKQGWMYKKKLITLNKKVYYLKADGVMATGWKTVSGDKYYFTKSGAYTGRHVIESVTYYFDSKGRLRNSGANIIIASDCAVLVNLDTGKVLYSRNADKHHANASTTKLMTAILALENSELTDTVKASANAAAQEPTKLYLKKGEKFKMSDLLHSLLIPSHNDTAVAIAEHISGTTKKFVALMNARAKELGCTDTNFATPNGLDAGLNHYTTANDLVKIAKCALEKSTIRKIVKKKSYKFKSLSGNSYSFTTTNKLLGSLAGVEGMKTGYTRKAGHCFVGLIKGKNGNEYLSVVLGGPTSDARWDDSKKLLQYAYKQK